MFEFQRAKIVSKGSERIVGNRQTNKFGSLVGSFGSNSQTRKEKVEERLMRDALTRKKKQDIKEKEAQGGKSERQRTLSAESQRRNKEIDTTNAMIKVLESKGLGKVERK